ncbi:MAG: DUF1947 domain-containing protein [Candidatus Bathyarchaeia archaeon]
MRKVLRRHFLKEGEAKRVLNDFCKVVGAKPEQLFGPKPKVELLETRRARIFLSKGVPFSVKLRDTIFPTLLFKEALSLLSKVVVDMGAVPHICGGADVMAPGIVRIDGKFSKGDLVTVVDELHGKPLAIGEALFDSETLRETKRGKVVKNIHFVGDDIWNLLKTIPRKRKS